MENKENVLGLSTETEQAVLPQKNTADLGAGEGMDSAVFRKFKDANALAEAYGALEAEFTRRSQRLKELERRLEPESEKTLAKNAVNGGEEGAKTPDGVHGTQVCESGEPQAAVQPKEEVGHGEDQEDGGRESVGINAAEIERQGQGFGKASFSDGENHAGSVVAPRAESVVTGLSDDEIYRIATQNEGVRIKIVGEYLASLKNPGVSLVRGGVGAVASPPAKARSVAEAGDMALRFFQTATKQ